MSLDRVYRKEQDDIDSLVKALRALANAEHSDLTVAEDAADEIERLAWLLRYKTNIIRKFTKGHIK